MFIVTIVSKTTGAILETVTYDNLQDAAEEMERMGFAYHMLGYSVLANIATLG